MAQRGLARIHSHAGPAFRHFDQAVTTTEVHNRLRELAGWTIGDGQLERARVGSSDYIRPE